MPSPSEDISGPSSSDYRVLRLSTVQKKLGRMSVELMLPELVLERRKNLHTFLMIFS